MLQNALSRVSNGLIGGAILGGASLLLSSSAYVVPGGHRAIIFDRFKGVLPTVKEEGLHFRIPLLQRRPILYEIRTRFAAIQSETGSRDLQTVNLVLRLLYRPVAEKLPVIHKTLGTDYDDKVLPAIGNEVLKAVVAQYDAGQLITQRELVSTKIREILTARAADFNITLDDVSITHLAFGKEFTNAIEAKQVAQQDTERSKYIVAKNEQEKLAEVIRASGEAEAAKIIEEAMKSGQGFIELRKIQAAKDIAETLAKSRNVTYIPSGGNVLLNMGNTPVARPPAEKK